MTRLLSLAALVLAAALPSPALAQNPDADPTIAIAEDDPAMDAAIAEARRTLPEFLAVLADPPADASDFTIKFPLGAGSTSGSATLRSKATGSRARSPTRPSSRTTGSASASACRWPRSATGAGARPTA
jgi:hypothetical protein